MSFYEDFEPALALVHLGRTARNISDVLINHVSQSLSSASCGGEEKEDAVGGCRDENLALHLKMGAIAAILVAGIVGVSIPLVGKKRRVLRTNSALFVLFKAFAAGVILATGFVHMLPDGQEALTDSCLPKSPWSKFPFSGFVAMLSALATLVMDFVATQYYEGKNRREQEATRRSASLLAEDDQPGIRIVVDSAAAAAATASATADGAVAGAVGGGSEKDQMHIVGMHAHAEAHRHGHGRSHSHCHCHSDIRACSSDEEGGPDGSPDPSPDVRHVVVSQILELGIVSHSVIIGLSLGVSHSPCTIRPLIGALAFHQFFEGFALGGCISQAQFQTLASALMACFFAVTTPLGIAAGAALSSFYNPNSPRALVVEGVFDCVSAGILIYMALVDLIAADFLSQTLSCSRRVQVASYFALFLGAASMSLLAIWA